MATVDPNVMSAVEAALQKDPAASVDELFALAQSVNPATADLTKRQFHARYPLQVKRKMNPVRRKRRRKKAQSKAAAGPTGSPREAVRSIFLDFASELAGAEARGDIVRVIANVDRWVDEALAAAK